MPTLNVTDSNAIKHELEFSAGENLMELLREHDFEEIAAICGGACSCATCHVKVIDSPIELPAVEDDELLLLELADEYDETKSRLSCQLELSNEYDGLNIQLVAND